MGFLFTALALFGLMGGTVYMFTQFIKPETPGFLGDIRRHGGKAIDYTVNKANPLCLIFFSAILYGGFFGFFTLGYPWLPENAIERYTSWFVLSVCLLSFYFAVYSDPGVITKDSFETHAGNYAYDNTLFFPGQTCSTCVLPKLARSKHCKMCNVCVARFDHHCVWINNCVGEGNYGRFLFFLGSHAFLLSYGTYVLGKVLFIIMDHYQVFTATYRDPRSGTIENVTYYMIFQFMLRRHAMLTGLMVLMLGMGIAIILFFFYHVSLWFENSTTNEKSKRSDLREWISFQMAPKEEKGRKMEAISACSGCDVSKLSPFALNGRCESGQNTDTSDGKSKNGKKKSNSSSKHSHSHGTEEKKKTEMQDISGNVFLPKMSPVISYGLDETILQYPPITTWSVEYWQNAVKVNIYDLGFMKNLLRPFTSPVRLYQQTLDNGKDAGNQPSSGKTTKKGKSDASQKDTETETIRQRNVQQNGSNATFQPLEDGVAVGCVPRS